MKKRLLFLGLLTLLLLSVLPLLSCVGHTHTLTQYAALAPTCTSDGFAAYEACSGCDYTTYEPIPATGHTYPDTYATTARLHRRTCTVCAYTDEAEHTFDEGTVTRKPTCTERGEVEISCTCGRTVIVNKSEKSISDDVFFYDILDYVSPYCRY